MIVRCQGSALAVIVRCPGCALPTSSGDVGTGGRTSRGSRHGGPRGPLGRATVSGHGARSMVGARPASSDGDRRGERDRRGPLGTMPGVGAAPVRRGAWAAWVSTCTGAGRQCESAGGVRQPEVCAGRQREPAGSVCWPAVCAGRQREPAGRVSQPQCGQFSPGLSGRMPPTPTRPGRAGVVGAGRHGCTRIVPSVIPAALSSPHQVPRDEGCVGAQQRPRPALGWSRLARPPGGLPMLGSR